MEPLSLSAIGYAVICGIVPPIIWMYFLLREDKRCPEPPMIIFIAFLAGLIAVPLVIPIEAYASNHISSQLGILIAWAITEEGMKFAMAGAFVLWRKEIMESLDLVIIMITVALGFAALENTLFLLAPFSHGDFTNGLITDNLRFIGSTLLHVVASSAIGFALAFSYKQKAWVRITAAVGGLILAIALHTLFNFFIIGQNGGDTVVAFFFVWTGAIIFFALFEIVKYFRYRNLPANTC